MVKLPKPLRFHRNSIRQWLVVAGLLTERFSPLLFVVGCLLTLVGALTRLWAKGYLTQRKGLTTSGPYALSRNPFYLGNLVLDLGVCAMIGRIEVALPYLALWAFFHYRRIFEEERELEQRYGEAYLAYKRSVPRLLPTNWRNGFRATEDGGRFSWANPNISQGIEVPRFVGAISLPFLFHAWHQILVNGAAFFHDSYTLDFGALCVFLWLQLLARGLRKPLCRRSRVLPAFLSSTAGRTAFILGFLVFVFFVRYPEVEFDDAVLFPGGVVASAGLAALALLWPSGASERRALVLELMVCALASFLGEVPWAFALPLLFYSLLFAERIILGAEPAAAPPSRVADCLETCGVWARARIPAVTLVAVAVFLLKEAVAG